MDKQMTSKVERITTEEAKDLLDDSDTILIDVRLDRNWQQSDQKIKGAVREDPMTEEASWAKKYPRDKNIVLY
jgi:rhodanese-related sulfurtransferase